MIHVLNAYYRVRFVILPAGEFVLIAGFFIAAIAVPAGPTA